jgi:hypothetical protein
MKSYCDTQEIAMDRSSLESRVKRRIARKKGDVFVREDFSDLGGYDQVGRVLRDLTRKGELVRIGYGLYSRAATSIITGAPIPVRGLRTLREGLKRVGIKAVPSRLEKAYNAGETTQVPTGRVVAVNRRVRRKIGYEGISLAFERA